MRRRSKSDPLTADDVALRLNHALERAWRIMWDVRHTEGALLTDVRRSSYLGPAINHLAYELSLDAWNIEAFPMKGDDGGTPATAEP